MINLPFNRNRPHWRVDYCPLSAGDVVYHVDVGADRFGRKVVQSIGPDMPWIECQTGDSHPYET